MCKPYRFRDSAGRVDAEQTAQQSSPRPERGTERVGDRDRDEIAGALRVAAAEGRLEMQELEDRLAATYSAKTRDDLAAVTTGLEDWLASRRRASRATSRSEVGGRVLRHSPGVYAVTVLVLIAIWLLTGAGYFWPIWPALGWGLPLVMRRRAIRHTGASAPA